MVKPKTASWHISASWRGRLIYWVLPVFSLLTFIFSWAGAYRSGPVERWYARAIYPKLSVVAGRFADLVRFSWADVVIPAAAILIIVLLWKRRWAALVNLAAGFYLIFFWTWGLNYHRQPLDSKIQLDSARMQPAAMEEFAKHAAAELNRLYAESRKQSYDESRTHQEAARRVRRVVEVVDGLDWPSAERIKISRIANPWLRAAGIDGFFNPLGHEPVISSSILDVERPFVISHELAHVRGYPDEGDANMVAVLATLMSKDPAFQYSGWLNLWMYLRTRELDALLDAGPRHDIQRILDRVRAEQIRWVNDLQQISLDWFLKANNVHEGVQSYSRAVLLAAASEPFWESFR